MDGWVTIGTKLDSKQLDKDLKEAERELNRFEKESEKLTTAKAKVEIDLQDYEKQKEKIKQSTDELLTKAQTEEQVETLLSMENNQLDQLNSKYSKQFAKIEEINKKLQENAHNQGLVKKQTQELTSQLSRANQLSSIQKSIDSIGSSIKQTTRNVGRWAVSLFGVASAYAIVRQSMSTLSEYNEDLANKISNVRLVLATALEPVINRILGLVVTLLTYLNYITKTLFGLDLFARAGELTTNKMAKDLKSGSKSAKELKKQLAGFDEMNVLQDNTSANGGGGGASSKVPEFNLPEGEVPQWLKDLVNFVLDNKDAVIAGLVGIASALGLLKLGLNPIMALGLGIAIAGVVFAIESLLKYLKNPTWENFGKIIQGIGVAIIGLGIAFLGLPAIIIGVAVLIVGTIIRYWEQIKAKLQQGIDWLKGQSDNIHKKFGDTIGNIYDTFVEILGKILQGWDNTFKDMKKVFDELIKFVKAIINKDWKGAWESAKNIVGTIFDTIVKNIKLAFSSIVSVLKVVGSTIGNALGNAIKGAINSVLNSVESTLNVPINAINGLLDVINRIPGVKISRLSRLRLPRLAKGGVINQPGRGVMVGSAVAGERGQEGVIPLTDSQQMALLGEAIGKYITINANITNTMNGRVISRELQKIQDESNFAFNG